MNTKRVTSLVLNIVAIVCPTAALMLRYGADTRVSPDDASTLVALVAAMLSSFLIGSLSARSIAKASEGFGTLFDAIAKIVKDGPSSNSGNRNAPARRAA